METLVDLLKAVTEAHRDAVALSIHAGLRDHRWSYDRLGAAARAVAHHLRADLGLGPGTPLVVCAANSPQLAATCFGAMLARVVVVPLDPASSPEFIAKVVDLTGAPCIVAGVPAIEGLPARTVALPALPFDGDAPELGDAPQPDDVAEVVFTSGTTGFPKGVMLTHRNIVANVESARLLVPQRSYRVLSVLPLSHMLEQTVGLYVPLLFGSTIHYPVSRQPPVLLKAMQRYGITSLVVVPQVLELMLHGIEREVERVGKMGSWDRAHRLAPRLPIGARRALFGAVHRRLGGHLEFVICGGAPLPPDLQAAWERLGVRVVQGYGMTECSPIVAANTYWSRVPGSVGRPVAGVEVRLSAEGELLVAGSNVSTGYWRDPLRTADAFDEDGWYHSGDLATLDATGNIHIDGRLGEIIVLPSGMNVYPEDVERELRAETAIADCVVLSTPDERGNARLHAALIPSAEGGDGEETEHDRLARAVRNADSRLAPHQHVTSFSVWREGDFPRNTLLKVKRHQVLDAITAAADRPAPPHRQAATARDTSDVLAGLLGRVTTVDRAAIGATSHLELDLGLDSLTRVELAVLLEDEFGIALEEGDLAAAETVGDLSALVEGRSHPASPPSFPNWSLRPAVCSIRAGLQQLAMFPLLDAVTSPFRVIGVEELSAIEPPVLFIANHSSHLDTPSILRALPPPIRKRTAVAAAADYFYASRRRGMTVTLALNTFPFSREGAVRSSLDHCGELMDAGWSILVYPEGTRSITGRLRPFRSGIGLLATGLGAPVVPIAVVGTYALLPKGSRWPRRGPVAVAFGPAIAVASSADHVATTALLEGALGALLQPGAAPPPPPRSLAAPPAGHTIGG